MFQAIFKFVRGRNDLTRAKLLDGYSNEYAPWSGNAYDNATVRSCVDTIARHAGKLKARHVTRKDGNIINIPDDPLNYILGVRPNMLMTASEFLEKVIAQYYTYNNLFVYIQRDERGQVTALWPLHYASLGFYEDAEQHLYVRFTFGAGEQATVPYEEIIHIRRHYNRDELFGDPDNRVLTEDLNLLRAVKVAIINAVKNFNKLRGIIKWKQVVRPEDLEKHTQNFIQSFAQNNASGIGALDEKADYQQLTSDITTFDKARMEYARDNIYKYFGLSDDIVRGQYNEDQYNAFYESVIEPIAIKLSQEFTAKLFTQRQRGFGNEVIFETNRLQYMSIASRVKLCTAMIPAGAIKRNEIRELFGYAGLPGKEGEEIVVSLNYVKTKDQTKYQTGQDEEPDDSKGGDDDDNQTGVPGT